MSDGTIQTIVGVVGTIVGTVLGFILAAGHDSWKRARDRKGLKQQLMDEVQTNLHMIPQKGDVLAKMIGALKNNRVLAGESVGFAEASLTNTTAPSATP